MTYTARMPSKSHGAQHDTSANDEDAASIEWSRRVREAEAVPEEYSIKALVFTCVCWIAAGVAFVLCMAFGSDE